MTTPAPVFVAARRPRTPLTIDLDRGLVAAGGQRMTFDPAGDDAPYLAYLRLVRRLRDVHREPSFVLRRDDVEALAGALRQDAVLVLERLGELMGATVTQRRTMVTSFAAGAVLIAVATGAAALVPGAVRPAAESPAPTGGAADAPAGPAAGEDAPTDEPAGSDASSPEATDAADRSEGAGRSADAGGDAVPAPAAAATPEPRAAVSGGGAAPTPVGTPAPAPVAPPRAEVPDEPPPATRPTPPPATDVTAEDGAADGWRWAGPEVVQPGADIDIPGDEADDDPVDPSPDAIAS